MERSAYSLWAAVSEKKKKTKAIESRKSPVTTRGVTRMWLCLVRVQLSDYLFVEKGSVLWVWSHSLMYNVSQNPILERWQICHRAASPSQLPPPASSVGSESVDPWGLAENTAEDFCSLSQPRSQNPAERVLPEECDVAAPEGVGPVDLLAPQKVQGLDSHPGKAFWQSSFVGSEHVGRVLFFFAKSYR